MSRTWTVVLVLVAGLFNLGCATEKGGSTMLRNDDFDLTTAKMVDSLARSAFLTERTSASPPAVVVIDRVDNLTSDIIPPAEQWMLMARVQGALPVMDLRKTRNIVFVIPPERELLAQQGGYQGAFAQATKPTHALTAVFRSTTRLGRDHESGRAEGRTEYYLLQYQLTEIVSRQVIWQDQFEFRRRASGLLVD